jgi:uncharacterized membrane protein affecting hemolysin expression
MSPGEALAWLADQTTSVALVVALALVLFLALWRKVLVFGWVYEREKARADRNEKLAMDLLRQIAKAHDIDVQ